MKSGKHWLHFVIDEDVCLRPIIQQVSSGDGIYLTYPLYTTVNNDRVHAMQVFDSLSHSIELEEICVSMKRFLETHTDKLGPVLIRISSETLHQSAIALLIPSI
jgi:hypothetical protein